MTPVGHEDPTHDESEALAALQSLAMVAVAVAPAAWRAHSQWLTIGAVFAVLLVCEFVLFVSLDGRPRHRLVRALALCAASFVAFAVLTRPGFGVFASALTLCALAVNPGRLLVPSQRRTTASAVLLAALGYGLAAAWALAGPRVVVPAGVAVVGAVGAVVWGAVEPERYRNRELAAADRVIARLRRSDRTRASRLSGFAGRHLHRAARWFTFEGPPWATSHTQRWVTAASVGFGALALAVAWRDTREVLFDDAAIIFRYVERIATGHGFTYNDGDRTNGASAPLYTLVLTGLRLAGADPQAAAKAIGAVCYAASVALAARLGGKRAGLGGAFLSGGFLLASIEFRTMSLTGLESAVATALGLGAIALCWSRRDIWCGIALGLAVTNKLDAGLLAISVIASIALVQRRLPRAMIAAAGLTAAPWLMFSWIYFGSPLPHSASQKLGGIGDPTSQHDPLWVLRTFWRVGDWPLLIVAGVGAGIALAQAIRRRGQGDVAALACAMWGFSHFAAFSFIDLGDPYPWYATVIFASFAVTAATAFGTLVSPPVMRGVRSRRTAIVACSRFAACGFLVLAAVRVPAALEVLRDGHVPDGYEEFDGTRRDAGLYLAEIAEPGDVVRTCFGWIAYGALEQTINEVCPLSTRRPTGPPRYAEVVSWPGRGNAWIPTGATVLRTFWTDVGPGGETLVLECAEEQVADDCIGVEPSP